MRGCYFKYRDGPAVGPFYGNLNREDVHDRVMDMANAGEAPAGRPGEGDLVALQGELYEVKDFGFEKSASGAVVEQMKRRWESGPCCRPRGHW